MDSGVQIPRYWILLTLQTSVSSKASFGEFIIVLLFNPLRPNSESNFSLQYLGFIS